MTDQSVPQKPDNLSASQKTRTTQGVSAALGAFLIWGLFPLFFKAFGDIPAMEIMAHRIVWSMVFVLLLVMVTRRMAHLKEVIKDRRTLLVFAATTLLIGVNWLVFIWAISVDRVLEASLGYYINPLVSIMLGVIFLKERLNKWQGAAVVLAALAVVWMTVQAGVLPWVSLVLAFSFGFYGLLRKMITTESAVGLAIETSLLTPISAAYIIYLMMTGTAMGGSGDISGYDWGTFALLFSSGAVTAIPLILFSMGAQRLKLGTVGIMQYIAPTLHVLFAVFMFGEPFTEAKAGAFGLIWIGLVLYSWDGLRNRGR